MPWSCLSLNYWKPENLFLWQRKASESFGGGFCLDKSGVIVSQGQALPVLFPFWTADKDCAFNKWVDSHLDGNWPMPHYWEVDSCCRGQHIDCIDYTKTNTSQINLITLTFCYSFIPSVFLRWHLTISDTAGKNIINNKLHWFTYYTKLNVFSRASLCMNQDLI